MNAVVVISLWGILAIGASAAAGVVAAIKNRDHSWWAAWSFVLPPMLIALLFMPANKGPRPRARSFDEDDRERELH